MQKLFVSWCLFASALCAQTSPYPGALDTNSTLGVAANRVSTKLSVAMSASDTTIQVASATRIVANVILAIDATSTSPEYVWVCSVSGNTLTLGKTACPNADGRGADGTTAAIHASGATVAAYPQAWNFNALASGLKATQNALGANLSAIAAGPFTNSAAYNFTPQSPGGSLVIGANVITMTPCPLGVAGSHTVAANLPHLLYVSGGVGTAEAVPIAGGTCTSGATTGTLIISAANTHSGAWTIQSNTTGVQEAVYVAGAAGAVRMPAGNITLQRNTAALPALTIPDGYNTSLRGQGRTVTTILTGATTRDWITFDYVSAGGLGDLGSFSIQDAAATAHTTGTMIKLRYRNDMTVSDIYINQAWDGVLVEGNARFDHRSITIGTSHYGYYVGCAGVNYPTCLTYGTASAIQVSSATSGTNAIRIEAPTAGIILDSPYTGSASNVNNSSIALVAVGTNPWNEIQIGGACILDGHAVGVNIVGNGASFTSNSIGINNCRITAAENAVSAANWVAGLSITNSVLTSCGVPCGGDASNRAIVLSATKDTQILNNPQINSSGDAGILTQGTNDHLDIIANTCGNIASEQPTACISLGGATQGLNIKGNWFNAATTAITSSATLTAPVMVTDNTGIDNVIPAVASAATLAFPLNPNFTLSGSTNVTAVTFPLGAGAVGAHGTVTATAATLTFTLGASIGDNFILKQNTPASWYWDGTKVWLSGQDPALSRSANYIATESGANNAIIGDLTGVPTIAGVTITIKLAHTLQAGANTLNFNSGGAVNIKSSRNTANNIGTAYAATGIVTLTYDGAVWLDVSQ